jgi:hypothetical protein
MDALLRLERAIRRLPEDAACVVCGETDPVLLELHHIAGRPNDEELVVVLCLNHHRQQSVRQRASGVDLDFRHDRTVPERAISLLRGLALMFTSVAVGCRWMADQLGACSARLDADFPEWRTPPDTDT